jgi:hypothetical protein
MPNIFVFQTPNGNVAVGGPTDEALQTLTIEQIAAKDTPPGTTYYIVDSSTLPVETVFFDSWAFTVPPAVEVDLTRAKVQYKASIDLRADQLNTPLTEQYIVLLATEGDTTAVAAEITAISDAAAETAYLSATTVSQLIACWPPELGPNPFLPTPATISGTMSGSRTGNDFNDSYYVTFNSDTLVEDDTELFIPSTSTVIPYILPNQFNGYSEAFTTGNYVVQIRQTSTGLILAQYTCPAGPPDVVVPF